MTLEIREWEEAVKTKNNLNCIFIPYTTQDGIREKTKESRGGVKTKEYPRLCMCYKT